MTTKQKKRSEEEAPEEDEWIFENATEIIEGNKEKALDASSTEKKAGPNSYHSKDDQAMNKNKALKPLREDVRAKKEKENIMIKETEGNDDDIFRYIEELLKSMPKNHIRITWMPAHLDEEKNSKKEEYFSKGGLEVEIKGNCAADELAKEGAKQHSIQQHIIDEIQARKYITTTTQDMMVLIWKKENGYEIEEDEVRRKQDE